MEIRSWVFCVQRSKQTTRESLCAKKYPLTIYIPNTYALATNGDPVWCACVFASFTTSRKGTLIELCVLAVICLQHAQRPTLVHCSVHMLYMRAREGVRHTYINNTFYILYAHTPPLSCTSSFLLPSFLKPCVVVFCARWDVRVIAPAIFRSVNKSFQL